MTLFDLALGMHLISAPDFFLKQKEYLYLLHMQIAALIISNDSLLWQ